MPGLPFHNHFDDVRWRQGMSDRLAAHGGTLAVRSRPGQGTTITGCLPAGPLRPELRLGLRRR